MPRVLTPDKKLLFKAVVANPGLKVGELAKLTGIPKWKAKQILPELAGRGLINYQVEPGDKLRIKRWYLSSEIPLNCYGRRLVIKQISHS